MSSSTRDILVLVIEVLAPLGKADSGKALPVEGTVISAAQVAVGPATRNGAK